MEHLQEEGIISSELYFRYNSITHRWILPSNSEPTVQPLVVKSSNEDSSTPVQVSYFQAENIYCLNWLDRCKRHFELIDILDWFKIILYVQKDKAFSPFFKVKKNLEDSLDSIPSPSLSVKIQIMGGKVGGVTKLFVQKSLLTMPSNIWPKK